MCRMDWTPCSASCGMGVQYRGFRVTQVAVNGGKACTNKQQQRACTAKYPDEEIFGTFTTAFEDSLEGTLTTKRAKAIIANSIMSTPQPTSKDVILLDCNNCKDCSEDRFAAECVPLATSTPGCWPPGYKAGDKKVSAPYKVIKRGGIRACDCEDTTLNDWQTAAHLPFLRKWLGPGVRVKSGDDCDTFDFTAVVPWSKATGKIPKQICATDSNNDIDFNAPPQYYYSYASNVEMASLDNFPRKHPKGNKDTKTEPNTGVHGKDNKPKSKPGVTIVVTVVVVGVLVVVAAVAIIIVSKNRRRPEAGKKNHSYVHTQDETKLPLTISRTVLMTQQNKLRKTTTTTTITKKQQQ